MLLRGGCVTSFTINARDSSSFVPFTEEELWKECANAQRFSPEEGGGEAEEGGEKKKRKDEKDDGGVMNAEAGEGAGTPKETLMNGWSELQKRVKLLKLFTISLFFTIILLIGCMFAKVLATNQTVN